MKCWTHAFLSSNISYEDPQKMAVCGFIQKRSLRFVLANFCGVSPRICGIITMFMVGK